MGIVIIARIFMHELHELRNEHCNNSTNFYALIARIKK